MEVGDGGEGGLYTDVCSNRDDSIVSGVWAAHNMASAEDITNGEGEETKEGDAAKDCVMGFVLKLGAKGVWVGMMGGMDMQTIILVWITVRTD
ncbi:hypothetical protein K1719_038031 [Acacia pycnantha]|nr:hypothetical protein K1719_038031 [Acacia pycnantha]